MLCFWSYHFLIIEIIVGELISGGTLSVAAIINALAETILGIFRLGFSAVNGLAKAVRTFSKCDEFIIETKNIFKTCGSCKREFVMLEDYLRTQGKKVKIVVFSDETIKGTARLKEKLKIK